MSETPEGAQIKQSSKPQEKYFSFQIKGWANFDPMDKTLAKVAEGIDQGNGFLTLVEVLKIENDVVSIRDEEVRTCFENLIAARRLIRNVKELPTRVKDELRAALKAEEEVGTQNIVTMVPGSSAGQEPGLVAKRWP